MKRFLIIALGLVTAHTYAQDIQKGVTFNDGQTIHGSDLNNAIDNATILPTFISGKGASTPLTTDFLLYLQNSTSSIKKVTLGDALIAGAVVNTTQTRTANTFLGGPASGAAAGPTFRLLAPADTADATNSAGGTTIDCSLARTFDRTLSGNTAYTLTNISDGGCATVAVAQTGVGGPYTATFTVAGGITWKGGVAPTQSTGLNRIDLYTFIHIGSKVYGSASQDYH